MIQIYNQSLENVCVYKEKTTQHVDEIDFFVKYLEPILHFVVIIGLNIRGFGIRGQVQERIYRE